MAIYHLTVKCVSRSGELHDYSRRSAGNGSRRRKSSEIAHTSAIGPRTKIGTDRTMNDNQ
jgi:hypothetical protein